jgi:hypothetical protein
MAARSSYSNPTANAEQPRMAVNWMSGDGRLRSHSIPASLPGQFKSPWLESIPNLKAITRDAAKLEEQNYYLLWMLCWLAALFL